MLILGLNAFHGDASACIIKDNLIIAAAEEERFTRIKHAAGFPINAINFCLTKAGVGINQIDHITINRNPKQKIIPKLFYASFKLLNFNFIKNRLTNLKKINSIKIQLEKNFKIKIKAKIHNIDHHISHIASSVFFSGFKNTNFISVDGFGDFVSTVTGYYDGKNIVKFNEVQFPHSLGLFYTAMTQFLGFNKYGDEYKVMGLAPYGEPIYFNKLEEILQYDKKKLFKLNLKYFLHHKGNVDMTWLDGEPKIGRVFSDNLIKFLGNVRKKNEEITQFHKNIASSTQKIYEEIFIKIVNDLYEENKNKNLCISGGCGMNSVANGKLFNNSKYENIYIPAAPGDAGGAIGSATYVNNLIAKNVTKYLDNPYLGPNFSENELSNILDKYSLEFKNNLIDLKKINDLNEINSIIAKYISQGLIVGYFAGKMEWGPRSLGNRSILADPRDSNIRKTLNLKIKRRESFRPFAPSILKDFTKEWFEIDDEVPFMSKVFNIRENKRRFIPAVTHIDGTGRLQTVSKDYNHNFYMLIKKFYEITNVPMVLNTSFNENEPIVCKPEEAIDCFLRTKMDILVLENFILSRN
tara:strand:+ start:1079 stop:2818 length:1740 start_codon:yes stop_codon:yes gene_type:complete